MSNRMLMLVAIGSMLAACDASGDQTATPDASGDQTATPDAEAALSVASARATGQVDGFAAVPESSYLVVRVALANINAPSPLPVGPNAFVGVTDDGLAYLALVGAGSDPCPLDVLVDRGGTITCDVVFRLENTKRLVKVRYLLAGTVEAQVPPYAIPSCTEPHTIDPQDVETYIACLNCIVDSGCRPDAGDAMTPECLTQMVCAADCGRRNCENCDTDRCFEAACHTLANAFEQCAAGSCRNHCTAPD